MNIAATLDAEPSTKLAYLKTPRQSRFKMIPTVKSAFLFPAERDRSLPRKKLNTVIETMRSRNAGEEHTSSLFHQFLVVKRLGDGSMHSIGEPLKRFRPA